MTTKIVPAKFEDTRRAIDSADAPLDAIVFLNIKAKDGRWFRGTGWLISPYVIVTAGHCLTVDGQPAEEVFIYRHRDGKVDSYQVTSARSFKVMNPNHICREEAFLDFGVIFTETPIYAAKYFQMENSQNGECRWLQTSGFPGDRNKELWGNQMFGVNVDGRRIALKGYICGGQSGSPLYAITNDGDPVVFGIVHAISFNGETGEALEAWGTPITGILMQQIHKWIKEHYLS